MHLIRSFASLLAILIAPALSSAHESFLPLHHHSGSHGHDHAAHDHSHEAPDGKGGHVHETPAFTEERFAIATGGRYTRYDLGSGEHGQLWETGLGIDYAVTHWLHVGGDFTYGWYDSPDGRADGWMTPHAHLDFHLPIRGAWEVIVGLEVGFPGGDEALVGDHWEWAPHLELRYDPGHWFAEAGASLSFIVGEEDHDHSAHEHEGENHGHGDTADFHEIVDPHGKRELDYYGTVGLRLLDRRLTLAGRFAGVHVLAGDTPADDYLRAGLRVSYQVTDQVLLSTEASLPITDAERNQWQISAALRVGF